MGHLDSALTILILKIFAVLAVSASYSLSFLSVDIALVAWIIEQRTDMPFLALH